jgi:hypothetical protein
MTIEERCNLAIERGYTYNPNTGDVFGFSGNKLLRKNGEGYPIIKVSLDKKEYQIKAHQFAWYWVNREVVDCLDHINGVRDDNRIINLRSVTKQQNSFNFTKSKGYTFVKDKNKFRATISIDGKKIHLGYFLEEETAREAYEEAKKKYHVI